MANVFEVTAGQASTEVEPGEHAELSFDVKNPGANDRRVSIVVIAQEPARPEWFKLEGAVERFLGANGTIKITVQALVPVGSPARTYAVQLKVSSVTNPDEEYTLGQTSAVVVKEKPLPEPPQPWIKRYWWILAVIAAVAIVVTVVVLLIPKGAKLNEACEKDGDCAKQLACTNKKCLGVAGFDCASNADCATSICNSTKGKCIEPTLGDECQAVADCQQGQSCIDFAEGTKLCLLQNGQACTKDQQCVSGACTNGSCGTPVAGGCGSLANGCPDGQICHAPTSGGQGRCMKKCLTAEDCAGKFETCIPLVKGRRGGVCQSTLRAKAEASVNPGVRLNN